MCEVCNAKATPTSVPTGMSSEYKRRLKPIFILEGCDGTGKSTLATQLSLAYGIPIIHSTAHTDNTKEYHMSLLRQANETGAVLDRFFWGDFVYAHLFGRKPKMTVEELHECEKYANEIGARIIHVTANNEDIITRLTARGDETKELISKVPQIVVGYSAVINFVTRHSWMAERFHTSGGY